MNIRFRVTYDGTRYEGWQKQVRTRETIQGKLETAIEKVTGETVQVLGAGRTDAGVHSRGQTANARFKKHVDLTRFEDEVNQQLPSDIGIEDVREVPDNFHSRFSAVNKTYVYRIRTSSHKQVFLRRFIWQYGKPLDVKAMGKAAELLTGSHDFKSFTSNKKTKKSTVRRIDSITLEEKDGVLSIAFTGDGFLTGMVRILTGTLVEVGEGKKKVEDMPGILESRDRSAAGFTAPPEGLTLEKVQYEEE
jgi:tRNA pseudouridine38-40 synthase